MQRILNNPDNIVDEMLQGFLKAHSDLVEGGENPRVVKVKNIPEGKVGVITGGGSGHKPAFIGYVGKNLCDAAAVGEICSSPTAVAFLDAAKEADQGKGVACLYGNYSGDNMNVKMAVQMAEDDDIEVKYVVANDDVASAPKAVKEQRHGIAGGFFMWKVGGARAAKGGSLDDVIASAQNVVNRTKSICVGLEPCVIPALGHSNFKIEDGTMEFGVGHHGEAGTKVEKLKSASEMAQEMAETILNDFDFEEGKEVAVMLSGLGATPVMELYVLYDEVEKVLAKAGHKVWKTYIGNYVTSLTIVDLDDEIKELLSEPAVPIGMKNY